MSKFLNTNEGKILIEVRYNRFWKRWQVVADGVVESETRTQAEAVAIYNGYFPIFN